MNYTKIYIALLNRGAKRTYQKGQGLHGHHVVPYFQWKNSDNNELVYLTPKEHRLVHKLRYKLFCDPRDMFSYAKLGGMLTYEHYSMMGRMGGPKGGRIGGKKGAATQIANKIGIHGLSKERHSEIGRMGGLIGGRVNVKNKRGFFGVSKEQDRKNRQLGGIAAAKDRKWIRCLTTGKLSRPPLERGWLMILAGTHEYRAKNEQIACHAGLLKHQEIFLRTNHD